ncbi:hypothetical protein Chor_005580 [Crotalus horridus]
MKEIEHLVEGKTKESSDMSKLVREVLNGSQRVVVDGLLSEEECRMLQRLTNLGQEGRVPMQSAYLYYNATEKVRRVVESYFRLDAPLHFSYSHLVCRTAIEDKQADRTDPSHPVHVDNCILNAEAMVCVKEPPAYTFRDYSAILYLNGDFEGGEFYFTELDATTVTAEVRPHCGRAVGFSAGSENPHGVKAVTKGQRCAIALWFTLDPRQSERVSAPPLWTPERIQADDLVRMLFKTEETKLPPETGPSPEEAETPPKEAEKKDEL